MAVNMFEGSRRLARLAASVWIVGWIVSPFIDSPSPHISLDYFVTPPALAALRSVDGSTCGDDGKASLEARTKKGNAARANICFRSERLDTKIITEAANWLIRNEHRRGTPIYNLMSQSYTEKKALEHTPLYRYRDDSLGGWNLPEVIAYRERVETNFAFSVVDEESIDRLWRSARFTKLGEIALAIGGGLLFLWSFSWVVGWIVRGFLGIPSGKDQRGQAAHSPPSSGGTNPT